MTATAQALRPPSRTLLLLEGRALAGIRRLQAAAALARGRAARRWPPGAGAARPPGQRLLAPSRCGAFSRRRATPCMAGSRAAISACAPGVEPDMLERIDELYDRHGGRKLSLVGWSLGGIYARQLAKLLPDKVRCVISLGSPFAGTPRRPTPGRSTNSPPARRSRIRRTLAGPLAEPPPVPTTSIFSRTDGICAWQTCLNEERAQSREHRGLWQPLRARPSSGRRLCRRRPAGPARGPVEEVRPLGLEEPGLSGLAAELRRPKSKNCCHPERSERPSINIAKDPRCARSNYCLNAKRPRYIFFSTLVWISS